MSVEFRHRGPMLNAARALSSPSPCALHAALWVYGEFIFQTSLRVSKSGIS